MRKFTVVVLVVLLYIIPYSLIAQTNNPKREFRATWIASVTNIDWPSSTGQSVDNLKKSLTDLLDAIKLNNLNAVFFQVRPECDALYKSNLEPWSYWITGKQGTAPAGDFDPLKFAIEEAHKRGLELHAWLNPYRARQASTYERSANHVSNTHPEWILKFGNLYILNPGMPQVRDYNLSIVMDIVHRYDVDGIHFDDYFYPYPPDQILTQDAATFTTYNRGFTDISSWRRDNVDILMKAIKDSIDKVKPSVKFGISPFGIWKNGVPPGIIGMDAYSVIYADPLAWLKQKSVDYLIPQLYWRIGGNQDYNKLMPWWADSTKKYGRHFYTGNIFGSYTNAELSNQLKANRSNGKVDGMVLFSAKHIPANNQNFSDSLKTKYYKTPAIILGMSWKDQVKPNAPTNLKWGNLAGSRGEGLIWNAPTNSSDGESPFMYAVYKFDSATPQQSDYDKSTNLYNIVGTNYASLKPGENLSSTSYFAVTSLDRNYNESVSSAIIPVQVQAPAKPLQILPSNAAANQKDTIKFVWENTLHSTFNRLQIATDQNFANMFYSQNNIVDTFKVLTGFTGRTTYYWRITASNFAGESVYSEVRSFTTGFPAPPVLLLPVNPTTNLTLTPTLVWKKSATATKYRVIVAQGLSIFPSNTIVDTTITDTTITLKQLKENLIFTWSVMAVNQYGSSALADVFKFKTTDIEPQESSIPIKFELSQNYPNPFNPSTKISYSIPKSGYTVLTVYNTLGEQIVELINKDLTPGYYTVEFNAEKLPSGVYIYLLKSDSNILSKKMILVK